MADAIEKGDIYFFYRPRVEIAHPQNLDDIQRFYMVLLPDGGSKGRLFVVGKKRMPSINSDQNSGSEREWMMISLIDTAKEIGAQLRPVEYETKTQGEQHQGEAVPVGEGRYSLFEHNNASRLAYRLSNPDTPGEAQQLFALQAEASYVVAIRNPAVQVEGFPEEKPDYPQQLEKKFAKERWLDVSDPSLLDYENVQLVLIGAHEDLADSRAKITGSPDMFGQLGLDESAWPTAALKQGKMAAAESQPEAREPNSDPSKAGKRGGAQAVKTASAAGIASALKGISLPSDRKGLVDYAKEQDAAKEIINVLQALPARQFKTMADVQKAVGEVK